VFEKGSIYWTETTGAHDVRGRIRDKYKELGWETGRLGYPTSDETTVTEGKKSTFEHGAIVWNSSTDMVYRHVPVIPARLSHVCLLGGGPHS